MNRFGPTAAALGLFGLGIGLVNIFAAKDILAQTAQDYRINVRYVRNHALCKPR